MNMNSITEIEKFKPANEFFIGIDSDGAAFDTMNIKHLKSFVPAALEIWDFGSFRSDVPDIWAMLALYSTNRGINRFISLANMFAEIRERATDNGIINSKILDSIAPDPSPLKDFISQSYALSTAALERWIQDHPAPMFDDVLRWNTRSDELYEKLTKGLLPYSNVESTLKIMRQKADIMVVSSAPAKNLDKDWAFSGLDNYIDLLASQEIGDKKYQLKIAAAGKYPAQKILMLGDSPSDLEAAHSNNALFYPVLPGREDESWMLLRDRALPLFFSGNYAGSFETQLINVFLDTLSSSAKMKRSTF